MVTTLRLNPGLKELFLDFNSFSDEVSDQFIQVLNDSKIVFLSLLGNNFSMKALQNISEVSRSDIKILKKTEYYQNKIRTTDGYEFLYEYF